MALHPDSAFRALAALLLLAGAAPAQETREAAIRDLTFQSEVFNEQRNFRIFLPPNYDLAKDKRYPVIYFFHGHGERHNRPPRSNPGYDSGPVYGGDNIAAFVSRNDVIVVKWDGANPRTPGEDYIRPYNISPVETNRQFPLYFPELVRHIDSRFRTIADRDHRATAGLSMGGFMSFWIAGKYPHLVGSASNFMGSSEFFTGPREFPTEYRHDEMYRNYEGLRTRIVTGSSDFIRWYHRRMNLIWDYTRLPHEHEEFDSGHGTPGMAKTLAFHMEAFRNPLPKPSLWHHADVYPDFDVWGWSVKSDRRTPGYTFLENAGAAGFRSSVREWLPGGKILSSVTLEIETDALYNPGRSYYITRVNLDSGKVDQLRQTAGAAGKLHFTLSGGLHEIGIAESPSPILAVAGWKIAGASWATAGKPVRLHLTLLNKGARAARQSQLAVSSPNPKVKIQKDSLFVAPIGAGRRADVHLDLTVEDPKREIVLLRVRLNEVEFPVEIPMFPDSPELAGVQILDGKSLPLWQRAVMKTEQVLGSGNGDGIAQAGETIAIAIPGDDAHRVVELFSSHPCVDLTQRLSDPWAAYDHVGATAKISLARINDTCAAGQEIPFFARYQLPDKPEHILRQGVVKVRIAPAKVFPPGR
ncbi:MAG TPA: alpha/beta hydrolase-fold protein [Bryobacteraceae bacterium]|nr:alpha/beta hydrolase-fold protein [Bryobacteraceae bacterium]